MVLSVSFEARHCALVEAYAKRHFTDPGASWLDAAIFYDLNERTLRRSLAATGTGWAELVRELRLERARTLLESTLHKVDYVARLAGYASTSSFNRAFKSRWGITPSQFRRGKKKPVRVGGPTGAFDHHNRDPTGFRDAGWSAVWLCELEEARERINDRRELQGLPRDETVFWHAVGDEVMTEQQKPCHLRDDEAHWRAVRRESECR